MTEVPPCQLQKVDLNEFICGWGAAVINICLTYPLHKIIFRQMIHNIKFKDATEEISKQGLLYLYRGILPPLCQKSIATSVMFGMYDTFRCRLEMLGLGNASRITAGVLSGVSEGILTPFERIQTLMQHSNYHQAYKNSVNASRAIAVQYGIKEFYRGFVPIIMRNGPGNAIFFVFREEADKGLPKAFSFIGTISKDFIIGAVGGSVASSTVYPFNVIKAHVQSQVGGPYKSVWAATQEIYHARDGRISNFYRGIHMNYTRSFISWGVVNIAYENLKRIIVND